jgi:hypothetical protein
MLHNSNHHKTSEPSSFFGSNIFRERMERSLEELEDQSNIRNLAVLVLEYHNA